MMGAKSFRARKRLRRDDSLLDKGGNVAGPGASSDDDPGASPGALWIIDRALREAVGRRLVSSAEFVDLLLDLRSTIVLDAALRELRDEVEVR
jgi:hypothetical protein